MTDATRERPDWLPTELFPYQDHFVHLDGHSVHYVDEGEGPVLLMLHGNPTYSFLYRGIIEGLSDRFRCIAVDYPGFGLSEAAPGYDDKPESHARVLEKFVDALQLDPFTPMVQDWGGPIGMWVAARHPDRVRALVVGNTWAWPKDHDRRARWFSSTLGGPVGTQIIQGANAFVEVLVPMGVNRVKLSDEVMNAYRGPFPDEASREPTAVFPREIIGSTPFLAELSESIAALADKPTLFVWGDKDIAFTVHDLLEWKRRLPRHRTRVLKGAAHYIQEDAPEEIASEVRAWWDEIVLPAEANA